ncbi:MAG: dihydrodipicolinate synthase family protein [archaeon]|jgi:4-hydroxy-tetrahydrodipicolinate synthase
MGLTFFRRKEVVPVFVPQKLSGLLLPIITPLNEDFTVDALALKAFTARLMNKGVKNFFVLNSFSESEFLSNEERKKILQIVSNEINGKGVLIVGCFGTSTDEIISRINEAKEFSGLCVVNVPLAALERELEFVDFFDSIFTQTSANIILYNNPSIYKKNIPPLWLDNIINWERLVGVIDSSKSSDYLDELGKYYQFTKIFEENDELSFDALKRGFSGLCPLSANAFPAYYIDLVDNYAGLDFHKLVRNEAKISALNKLLPTQKKLQAFKYALSLSGIIQSFSSPVLEELTEKEKRLVEDAFGVKKRILIEK